MTSSSRALFVMLFLASCNIHSLSPEQAAEGNKIREAIISKSNLFLPEAPMVILGPDRDFSANVLVNNPTDYEVCFRLWTY